MYTKAAVRVATRPAIGLTGGCAVSVAGVVDCTEAVRAVFVALAAWFKRFLVFIQSACALI